MVTGDEPDPPGARVDAIGTTSGVSPPLKRRCSGGAVEQPCSKKQALAVNLEDQKNPDTCDLVIFGDYMFPEPDWKGEIPSEPIAVSTTDPEPDAPNETQVRVFAMGNVSGSKYWEPLGSEGQVEAYNDGLWLPQIIADELHERIVEEGMDSVARGEFIEEACNESGESVLVVDATLLKKRCKAFYSMLVAKRILGGLALKRFFMNHVCPRSTMRMAKKFIEQGTSLPEAHATK